MRKFTRSMAVILSLSMTLTMGTPVFAAAESSNTPVNTEQTVTPTPAPQVKIPKTGFYTKNGKTYYNRKGKLVKNKYGYKIGKKYYRINKKGVVTKLSTAEGLAGARLDKCGGNLKKAFQWSSRKIRYWGNVGTPKKGQNEVEYYATYGFKNGRGDCYVMAATFCMMAKAKGYKVRFVKGTVPQRNGKNGAHAWCEIKSGGTWYVYDPNFAYSFRNNPKAHSGYKFKYRTKGTYQYNKKRTKITV